jgi:hypothetical protein
MSTLYNTGNTLRYSPMAWWERNSGINEGVGVKEARRHPPDGSPAGDPYSMNYAVQLGCC